MAMRKKTHLYIAKINRKLAINKDLSVHWPPPKQWQMEPAAGVLEKVV